MSIPVRVVNDLGIRKDQAAIVLMVEDLLSIVPIEDLAGLDHVVVQNSDQVAQAIAASPEGSGEPAECFNWKAYYQPEWDGFAPYIALNIDNIQFEQDAVKRSLIRKLWRRLNRRVFLSGQLYGPLFGCVVQHIESSNCTKPFPDDRAKQDFVFRLYFLWIRKRYYIFILPILIQFLNLETWKDVRRNLRTLRTDPNDVHLTE